MRFLKSFTLVLVLLLSISIALAGGFTENPVAIEQAADSVFMLEVYNSHNQQIAVGSGFLAFDEGLIVTNYHVIDGASYLVAVSDENERFIINKACILDQSIDLAILELDQQVNGKSLDIDASDKLLRAEKVVAIGSPAGLMNTISVGNISGFYKQNGKDWIQFTAPISSGSSGGALLNDEGKVIGVTTATYTSAQNLNMAVKARNVIALYEKWDKKAFPLGKTSAKTPAYTGIVQNRPAQSGKVYVTKTGARYHSSPDCSSMKNPIEMELTDALEKGYSLCTKCYR